MRGAGELRVLYPRSRPDSPTHRIVADIFIQEMSWQVTHARGHVGRRHSTPSYQIRYSSEDADLYTYLEDQTYSLSEVRISKRRVVGADAERVRCLL